MKPTLANSLLEDLDLGKLRSALEGKVDVPGVVVNGVRKLLPGLLHDTILDILLAAWKTTAHLSEYTDPARHPPDELSFVPVLEQEIGVTHKPKIELWAEGKKVGELPFDVTAALVVRGARLHVSDGKITAVDIGSLLLSGKVELHGLEIAKRESKPVPLPGTIELREPVEIDRAA